MNSQPPTPRLPFMARMALVGARDYLLWLVELEGVKKGAVGSVRDLIDKALAEDDKAQPSEKNAPCFDHHAVGCAVCKDEDWLCGAQHSRENLLAHSSAIEPIKPWWVPPIRYDKDRGYFLDAKGTLVATARVAIADHMQEQIAAAINASTDGGGA